MRLLLVGALAAVVAPASGLSATVASGAARTTISLASGSLVTFRGTRLQCLTFGPLAFVKGKRGIVCFKGPPRQRERGTYWAADTATTVITKRDDSEFDRIGAATTIHWHVTTSVDQRLLVTGTKVGCWLRVSETFDPGHKAVYCADVDRNGNAVGRSVGFVFSERQVSWVTFEPDGTIDGERTFRQPR